ncbi:uncharacterized protein Z520_02903 [Fonsecaea multimorphosa CBS 102226]|uniref:Ubiquitin-like domain-containing protein n=1 Tax=Fonsecaea multimorphosa CBS 102226 TaxID=1442371 RepID=A0A0D2HHH2_9EURO|nr:uncharacterized protein Z520_02903 [Fonsecaea multimorphosa CBS 102226]KIY01351.1 hypothetical protein Z520_02903 [Fonsecaea multimorphosa CBS 102226]OAL28627.1 hypothetical protein AYO22_02821 [Fonsecaea multimorphosa]
MTGYFYDCRVRDDVVQVRRRTGPEQLQISFKRTVRVPDNSGTSQLPPDLGNFPLYKVQTYANSLPPEMVAKGGVFLPMYQREAMWINFTANSPFAIKVYVGCVNAISGEPAAGSASAKQRRALLVSQGEPIQDYMVVPGQSWLDGIASSNGIVKQFVATPLGEGYTVEAQITGHEENGGLQIEITPAVVSPAGSTRVRVEICTGQKFEFCVPADAKVIYLQQMIHGISGIPIEDQIFVCCGQKMPLFERIADWVADWCGTEPLPIYLLQEQRGGGWTEAPPAKPETKEMGIAAGGSIKQVIVRDIWPAGTWHKTATIAFNVQILNASAFEEVTGFPALKTPVTMETYAELGLPFFKLYEEPSNVHGSFNKVKSIGEMDGVEDPNFAVPTKNINDDPSGARSAPQPAVQVKDGNDEDISNPAGALREFRHVSEIEQELRAMNINASDLNKACWSPKEGEELADGHLFSF